MTINETQSIKRIKEELVILRLQTRVLTEDQFKKKIDKIIRLVELLTETN